MSAEHFRLVLNKLQAEYDAAWNEAEFLRGKAAGIRSTILAVEKLMEDNCTDEEMQI